MFLLVQVSCAPMRRRFFTLLLAFSLVLCAVTVAIGMGIPSSITYEGQQSQLGLRRDGNVIMLAVARGSADGSGWYINTGAKDHSLWWDIRYSYQRPRHGFLMTQGNPAAGLETWMLYAPWWFLLVATGGLPLWVGAKALVRAVKVGSGSRDGLCRTCGYDLRATPSRCPECGDRKSGRPDKIGATSLADETQCYFDARK
jgi:hypothetical protein